MSWLLNTMVFFYTGLRTDNMTNLILQLYLVIDLLKACVDQKRKNTFDQSAALDGKNHLIKLQHG